MKLNMQKISIVATTFIAGTTSLAGCGTGKTMVSNRSEASTTTLSKNAATSSTVITAVGAENEYADVLKQIGGKYVSVTGIMNNPNTDPRQYEASTKDAAAVASATLVVQNGIGYDDFMNKLESSAPNSKRKVIVVAKALGYSSDTKNPHLWYQPKTMPRVAQLIANALSQQDPSETQYFKANLQKFDSSLQTWTSEMAALKSKFANAGVAVSAPLPDYWLQAAGMKIETPWSFQAAIMNGVDPSPEDVNIQNQLMNHHKVKAFLYNQQVSSSVTKNLLQLAKRDHIPIVGVYETEPPHQNYQSWMEAETKALENALENGTSTETIS